MKREEGLVNLSLRPFKRTDIPDSPRKPKDVKRLADYLSEGLVVSKAARLSEYLKNVKGRKVLYEPNCADGWESYEDFYSKETTNSWE